MRTSYFGLLLLSFLLFTSCKNTALGGSKKKLRIDKPNEAMLLTQYQPSFFTLKAQAEFAQENSTSQFKLELRMKSDSAIWLDFADPIIGLHVVRVLIRPDSAFMVNKLDRTYYKGDLSTLIQKAGISLDYHLLEQILLGNFPIVPEIDSLVKADKGKLNVFPQNAVANNKGTLTRAQIHQPSVRPSAYTFTPLHSNFSLYSTFERTDEEPLAAFPKRMRLSANTASKPSLSLLITEYSLERKPMPFNIPTKYKSL